MKQTKRVKPDDSVFKNREKEAKFWEENYDRAFKKGKPIKVTFAKNLSETVNIRLDPTTLITVRMQAKAKGLGPTQLIKCGLWRRLVIQ